jgi:hypothetical protein
MLFVVFEVCLTGRLMGRKSRQKGFYTDRRDFDGLALLMDEDRLLMGCFELYKPELSFFLTVSQPQTDCLSHSQ